MQAPYWIVQHVSTSSDRQRCRTGLLSRRCFACPGPHFSTPLRPRCAPRPAAALYARSHPPLRSRGARPQARDIPVLSSSHLSGHRRPALRSATTGPRAVRAVWCGGDGRRRGARSAAPDGRRQQAVRAEWPPPIQALIPSASAAVGSHGSRSWRLPCRLSSRGRGKPRRAAPRSRESPRPLLPAESPMTRRPAPGRGS
jgi:hypothetical protein